ncbi:MAG: tryptophan--tRNA ligase [Alphaproteobacteria bacterium]|jgi:tryptophanyl-tRNA synthetase|nr:tryptophan--tRNA ligase [Alphaproteobacteria bacterium]
MKRIFSGLQPSGVLTLGNYLGALRRWVELQESYDCLYCIVDMHAITMPLEPTALRENIYEVAATYMACGLDPSKSTLFIQSHVAAHAELGWMLGCKTPMGWLNRMTQFKDKAGKDKEKASLGLYGYPCLQAADILLYQTHLVPVGEDQKQHIELTRDIAQSVNSAYNASLFTLPEPLISEIGARIMSLRDGNKKMSKSDPSDFSRINLRDDTDLIVQKIKKARTDAEPLPDNFDQLADRPEARNLITIYASLQGQTPQKVCETFSGQLFSIFKPALTELVIEKLEPISHRINELLSDKGELARHLKKGAERAEELASPTLRNAQNIFGFVAR